ncbi:MAG: DUF3127 domain-containing protein [Bacteroidales bacterium]
MEITGKILQINEPITGESARGQWKKQEVIIETEDQFPKSVCLLNWNDKADISNLKPGEKVTAFINIESREFKGRWFTDVKMWKINKQEDGQQAAPPVDNAPLPGKDDIPEDIFSDDKSGEEDDLPF